MKKRILAIMAVLAGAAAGTAVTAVNYHLYRKEKEAIRKLAREKKDGPDVSDVEQTGDETADRKSEDESESVTSQTKDEEEEEDKEKLMEEYWRRAKEVYGDDPHINNWANAAKPVRNSRTGYAYISVQDAATKTSTCVTTISKSRANGGEWCPITKIEYAKTPLRKIEVVTKEDAK